MADAPDRPSGIEIHEAHYPRRAPVDAYGAGGFRFADMSHRGSILCVPSGIYAWAPEDGAALTVEAFDRVVVEAGEIELLLVGTGRSLVPLQDPVVARLREAGVRSEVMPTGAAVRTFNVLLSEERKVAAGLLAVD